VTVDARDSSVDAKVCHELCVLADSCEIYGGKTRQPAVIITDKRHVLRHRNWKRPSSWMAVS
jgi:hypothetical protein